MTLFIIVTAGINIALGYGLAIYLGRAKSLHATEVDETAPADAALDHAVATAIEAAAQISDDHLDPSHVAPAQAAAEAYPAVASAAPATPAEDAAAGPVELEQDVLAGIEEFRNQLAQMKAQSPADAAPIERSATADV